MNFLNKISNNSIAIFNSNDLMPTNADGIMGFKQNNDLFYLSGIDQEESILILCKGVKNHSNSYLFIKETSDLIKIWEGEKLTQQEAKDLSGITEVRWLGDFSAFISELTKNTKTVFINSNEHARNATEVQTRDDRFLLDFIQKHPWQKIEKSALIMHQLRYKKETEEIHQIQTAIDITKTAFDKVLTTIKPDIWEYEIEAEIIHTFIKNGSRDHAYSPIIAGGKNACILHYIDNDQKLKNGDLVLMDFGAEYGNYNADLTRTIPVNGCYTKRQKDVYNAVLRVMKASIQLLSVGNTFPDYNKAVGELMTKELVDLNLISTQEIKDQIDEKPAYRKYFMHGNSHSLGLDVHDVDDRSIPFAEGMVFTCEPGIYIPEEGIGIRIENNILITKSGQKDLTNHIPVEVEEIEDIMNK